TAKPGDLLFFNTGNQPREITHVGIYMGNGHMLHAPRTGKKVQYASVAPGSWFAQRLLGVRRVSVEFWKDLWVPPMASRRTPAESYALVNRQLDRMLSGEESLPPEQMGPAYAPES